MREMDYTDDQIDQFERAKAEAKLNQELMPTPKLHTTNAPKVEPQWK